MGRTKKEIVFIQGYHKICCSFAALLIILNMVYSYNGIKKSTMNIERLCEEKFQRSIIFLSCQFLGRPLTYLLSLGDHDEELIIQHHWVFYVF